MKEHESIKAFFKGIYILLKTILAIVAVLVLIIIIIVSFRRYQRVGEIKERYPHAFQLIEEKYDDKIYLSDHRYGSELILKFTAKSGFEDTYNINDLPQQEFYTLVGHEIFDRFKSELPRDINKDYFSFPFRITIKYEKSSDEYVYLELYEKDWSE